MEFLNRSSQPNSDKDKPAQKNDILFSPLTINKMVVPNRILMPAMHLNMVKTPYINDRIIAFYAARARGGAGALIAGYAGVNKSSGGGVIGAYADDFIEGLSHLREAMQLGGGKAGLQLNHAGRYAHSIMMEGEQAVAPSAVFSNFTHETPRALELEEIKQTIQDFADAAVRTKKAGFDFVEILAGTGYLISQFLSDLTNQRDDEYGGPWKNRMRFGLEIASAVRKAVGSDYPVMWRINGNDLMVNGIGRIRLQEYAALIVKNGADAISVNVGWHEARVPQLVTEVPRAAYAYLARGIKECVDVPVIAGHRINDPQTARQMIEDDLCDMVAMGRPLIADPDLPKKTAENRENEIIHCIACAQGCFDHLFVVQPVECLCNPEAGHELTAVSSKTDTPKKILVCGGGPAGMAAAAAAARRGHDVVLYERSGQLGGQLLIAGSPPGREEFTVLASDLQAQLEPSGVKKVVLGEEVNEDIIAREKPDIALLATGAVEIVPNIPGATLPHVVSAWDVLAGRVGTGKSVAIIGGGAVGVETAIFLAQKGTLPAGSLKFLFINRAEPVEDLYRLSTIGTKKVVIIEMLEHIGADIGKSTRWGMMQDMHRHRVRIKTNTRAKEITPAGVIAETADGMQEIPADTIVLALGSRSYNPLAEIFKKKGIPYRVIGDARQIAKAFDAIHEGHHVACAI
ncbi:MAG: 2 4-dienoyl-CoA reductase (NADPH2) [Syntrophaceae bacterium]|nr:MAG: 2 4-dienoyl-CoA reductase (NADPH2) [Syntrophaceae bacterium]